MRQRRESMQGTKAAPRALRRRLAGHLSLLACTLGLLAFFGGAQAASAEEPLEKIKSAGGRENPAGFLASKKQEAGLWTAAIDVSAGGPQQESDGLASFGIPYPEETTLKLTYRNEPESLMPKAPCLGSVNEPTAEPGNVCFYRGSGVPKEPTDVKAKFTGFVTAFGERKASGETLSKEGSGTARNGIGISFRTEEFIDAAPITVKEAAHLTARGSWAVTAP